METELKSLEDKVLQLLRLHLDANNEIRKLRRELADTNAHCEKLHEKMRIAVDRLEALLLTIPDNE